MKTEQNSLAVAGQVERRVRRDSLRDYTDEELFAEVARRCKERERIKPLKWCDECEHFAGGATDGFVIVNPCGKGHQMLFLMPDGPADAEWGYYKRWCHDRREKCR